MPTDRYRNFKYQKVVPYPAQTVYNAVAAVHKYAEFVPWCISSTILSRTDDGGELKTEISVGFRMLQSRFRSTVSLTPPTRIHAVTKPNEHLEALSFTWVFMPVGEQSTRVDLELSFTLVSLEHCLMWDLAKKQITSEYLLCFTRRCAALANEPPPPPGTDTTSTGSSTKSM